MPKEQLTLNKFEGGLSTDSDPRDIADNEFSALEGFDVDSIGRIRMMGKHGNHSIVTAQATAFAEGYGIFPFSSSYDDGAALVPTNYLALTDGSYVRIFDDGGPNSANAAFDAMNDDAVPSTGFSLGDTVSTPDSHTDVYASFYAAGGNLRVNDGNFTNYANVPKLLQYIQSKDYGKGTSSTYPTTHAQASVGGDWVVNNASIETGVTSSNLKMINLGSVTKGIIETSEGDNDMASCTADSDSSTPGVVSIAHNDLDWGELAAANDYYAGLTCSVWSGSTAYYGVVVGYQNSNPGGGGGAGSTGTFKIWASATGDKSFHDLGVRHDGGNWGFQVGQSDGYLWNADFSHADHNQKQRDVISDDWGVTLTFDEGVSGNGGWMPDTNTRYKFYNSTIFDGNQESNPEVFTMYPRKAASGETAHASVSEMYFANSGTSLNADNNEVGVASSEIPVTFGLLVRMRGENDPDGSGNFSIGSTGFDEEDQDNVDSPGAYNFLGGNERVTGGRIWWASNEDGYKKLYLLMEYDMERGARIITGDSSGDGAFAPWLSWVYPVASNPILRPNWTAEGSTEVTDPPIVEDYESLVLYPPDVKLNAKWKTSVVAGGRTFIGNIKRQQKSTFDGGGTWHGSATPTNDPEYPDRIVASPRGRFDTFPEDPNYEFSNTPGDGDRVVKLETFANRLIVFYTNKVEIFSLPAEELEQENPLIGLDGEHPGQACLTEFGVAWINSQGVYFYAGEKVTSLSDKIKNMWVGEDDYTPFWKSDTDDTPLIAYDPESKKLMCLKTSNVNTNFSGAEDILQFSFKTQAWTYKKNALTDNTKKRFTVYKGQLVFDNGVRVQTWNDSPSVGTGSGGNVIYTKDYDFGTPGVRKKVYKVYVTYKTGDASGSIATNIQVKYGVDGDSTPTETFKDGTNFSSNELGTTSSSAEWHVAELKPTTSATANNIKSFRLAFTCDNAVPAGFEINDITIIYRTKSVK